jgi:hypothetical protein
MSRPLHLEEVGAAAIVVAGEQETVVSHDAAR